MWLLFSWLIDYLLSRAYRYVIRFFCFVWAVEQNIKIFSLQWNKMEKSSKSSHWRIWNQRNVCSQLYSSDWVLPLHKVGGHKKNDQRPRYLDFQSQALKTLDPTFPIIQLDIISSLDPCLAHFFQTPPVCNACRAATVNYFHKSNDYFLS